MFPGERTAQFTVSYAIASSEFFELFGTTASIHMSPTFMFGPSVGITYVEKADLDSKEHRFDSVEQVVNETRYFSDGILNDLHPEADGEEGLLDMRVLAAIERSFDTGETMMLEPATRTCHVQLDQAVKLMRQRSSARTR